MKKMILSLLLFPVLLSGQIVQTNVETLDEVERTFKRWGGKEENILIQLLEVTNIDTEEKQRNITIEIKSSEREVNLSSINFGSIGVGSLGSLSTNNFGLDIKENEYEGFFTINPTYYPKIKDFINQTIYKKAAKPKNNFTYNISLDNKFNFSFVYDKNKSFNQYMYVMRLGDSWFTISYDEGLSLLRKLIVLQERAITSK